jgi:hypothetical protein
MIDRSVDSTMGSSKSSSRCSSEEQWDDWNDTIETFFMKSPKTNTNVLSQEVNDDTALRSSLRIISTRLHRLLLRSAWSQSTCSCEDTVSANDEVAVAALETNTHLAATQEPFNEALLGRCVRTGKNLFRWYIQIYLERHVHPLDDNPLYALQTTTLLELILTVLKWTVNSTEDGSDDKNMARYCSLYLFYGTYSPFPGDTITTQGMNYLLTDLDFPTVALDILTRVDSVALGLSLIRNLHNMVVTLPDAGRIVLGSQLDFVPSTGRLFPSWTPRECSLMTFSSICIDLMRWVLTAPPSEPAFPGEDLEDIRSEFLVEILRVLYALRIGAQLKAPCTESTAINKDEDGNSTLADVVIRIFQLSPLSSSSSTSSSATTTEMGKRIAQCQLSTVSLLMDSNPSFGRILMETDTAHSLLHILKVQVDDVVDNNRVDSTATAAMVPILAVLNKFATGDTEFRGRVKSFVFPADEETTFEKKVREQVESKRRSGGNDGGYRSANMSPLHAPRDTLRGKLVALLAWPESYIKRCTAEMLWTLCNGDATEYVHRVGFGSALPLLNAKGLATIPVS